MKRQWWLISALIVILALVPVVGLAQGPNFSEGLWPQGMTATAPNANLGTAFTYQGRLTDGGGPANGDYDFELKLYDAASGGSQVGDTVTVDDQTVADGLFTVPLDFGAQFTGSARWLEIGVRPGDSTGAYTTLEPRQPLTPTPYALSLRPGARIVGDIGAGVVLAAENTSPAGFGLWGQTHGLVGAGVSGYASATSGSVHGVWGKSNSTEGAGVYGEAPEAGVYGEATATTGYTSGVFGRSNAGLGAGVRGVNTATGGNAFGVYGSTNSALGYAGYFSNGANGVDIMAAGSGIIKSKADSVLYLSPHDMIVRGGSGVVLTPLDNGGMRLSYTTTGWKYVSIPVSTLGTLFGAPLYIKSIEVCYDTNPDVGYIGVTTVSKNNGGTGATHYILNNADRTSTTYTCYTVVANPLLAIDNSTWVQFNVWAEAIGGNTNVYTVKLILTETP